MCYAPVCRAPKCTRLACLRHAASVHPEPGSNSLKVFYLVYYPRERINFPYLRPDKISGKFRYPKLAPVNIKLNFTNRKSNYADIELRLFICSLFEVIYLITIGFSKVLLKKLLIESFPPEADFVTAITLQLVLVKFP